jgi:hypothetical protein
VRMTDLSQSHVFEKRARDTRPSTSSLGGLQRDSGAVKCQRAVSIIRRMNNKHNQHSMFYAQSITQFCLHVSATARTTTTTAATDTPPPPLPLPPPSQPPPLLILLLLQQQQLRWATATTTKLRITYYCPNHHHHHPPTHPPTHPHLFSFFFFNTLLLGEQIRCCACRSWLHCEKFT